MSTNLTQQDIVRWFRQQAQRYNDMADTIESEFKPNGNNPFTAERTLPIDVTSESEALKKAHAALEDKQMRFKELEFVTGLTKKKLKKLLTEANGFTVGTQGWVKNKQ